LSWRFAPGEIFFAFRIAVRANMLKGPTSLGNYPTYEQAPMAGDGILFAT
jgi:hypothetical protein